LIELEREVVVGRNEEDMPLAVRSRDAWPHDPL
jgi:hypothetical protein